MHVIFRLSFHRVLCCVNPKQVFWLVKGKIFIFLGNMLKTPVSVLEELMVKERLAAPNYQFHSTGPPHQMSFTCQVKAGDKTATGEGTTKKDSKHDGAKKMLSLFGVKMDSQSQMSNICLLPSKASNKLDGPVINYIGKLNEFCSGNKQPQPTYTETVTLMSTRFCIVCTLNSFKTEGYGLNKKDAKQEAAKNMLALIKDSNLEYIPIETNNKLEESSEISELVLKKYSDLMKTMKITDKEPENNNLVTIKDQEVNVSTYVELTKVLDTLGCRYELSTFQHFPLILSLKINEHVLMHYGDTREEVLGKIVENAVGMIRKGVDFSKPLIET